MAIDALIRRFARQRLLVIGDLMLDQFIWGRVERVSPEAPVPVVEVTRESYHLGGAGNVAHNLHALGAQVAVCGVIGADAPGKRLLSELSAIAADVAGVVRARDAVTIRKTRVIAHSQQVVRFDREQRQLTSSAVDRLCRMIRAQAGSADAVLVSDYGKGVINERTLGALAAALDGRNTVLVVDPKRANFEHYRGMTLATPNLGEAQEAAGMAITDDSSLRRAGMRLAERWQSRAVLITRGEQGMTLVHAHGALRSFPTVSRQVFDVTGAGDTVAAVCALALAAGASFEAAAALANQAAGIVVGKIGTATVGVPELRAQLRRQPVATE